MAIDSIQWQQIVSSGVKGAALSAGYPDILVRMEGVPDRPDTIKAQDMHGVMHPMPRSDLAFESIGLSLDVTDRAVYQGSERVANLNLPQVLGDYDLVIDPGTTEHCFNIPQAWMNLGAAVKVGGFLSQALPMSMFNHGYWNINPVAMYDFWGQNGFEIVQCVLRMPGEIFDMRGSERKRLKGVPDGCVVSMLAKCVEHVPFLCWPEQQLPS